MRRPRLFLFAGLTLLPLLARADEREVAVAAIVKSQFAQMDRNGDGVLTPDEVNKPLWFKRVDANADGKITLEEATQFFQHLATLAPKGSIPLPNGGATAPATAAAEPVREEPRRLRGSEYGIGTLVPDLALEMLDGSKKRLAELAAGQPLVVAVVSPTCPVSKRYLPVLAGLAAEARLLLLSNATAEEEPALRAALQAAGLTVPCARDADHALARTLGVRASTDAFLLDPTRTLVYRGAIDDQYGLGYSRDAARQPYLRQALAAAREQRVPAIEATEAPGCVLDPGQSPATAQGVPAYYSRVARVLQARCQECHRAGGVAPFPLETFEQVSAKAGMIRKMVERRLMPPWFAAAGEGETHSPWANDRSLTEAERTDLLSWIAGGKPAGQLADAPAPRRWPAEWAIGTPDEIVQIPQPLDVKATGTMPYIIQTVETGWTEDRWVRGFEVLPTAREVVHHVLIFAELPGQKRHEENFIAAYVPGNNSVVYPDGFAKMVPVGAKLRFQIHYTPNGTATRDQVRVGFLFAKEKPPHIVRVAQIVNYRISIPPNEDNHAENATIPVPQPVMVLAMMPHMHLRGKAFKYVATLPDGTRRTLLDVPRYDFNWQISYRLREPMVIPAGTTVQATGWFDNSTGNPANPNPDATVRFGPQTTDEMMLGYVEYCLVAETGQYTVR